MLPKINIVAAIGKNRELGKDNKLLWHIPEDLKHFKEVTSGHVVIMGRKTYESIGRLLPNRTNIIITRDATYTVAGAHICYSLEEALEKAKTIEKEVLRQAQDGKGEIFIIGGGQIFEQALPLADKLYLTVVEGTFAADVYFPDYSLFTKVLSEQKGESEGYAYTFLELQRS